MILDAQPVTSHSDFQEGKFPKLTENQSFKGTEKLPFEDWSMILPKG